VYETFFIDPRHRDLFPDAWETEVYEFLRQRVRPGNVCLDVGAHVGLYALSLGRWAGERGRVFAFEPNPHSRRVLMTNIRRNQLEDRITVVPMGVSDRCTRAEFFAADGAAFSRFGEPNPERREHHESLPILLTTLDTFCEHNSLFPDWSCSTLKATKPPL
jgi:FkbM family methyltransferase